MIVFNLETGRNHHILIVTSKIGSVGINFKEPESAALIGDGADFTAIRGAGSRRPHNHPDTRPEDNLFHVDGRQVQRMALDYSGPFLEKSCAQGSPRGLGDIQLLAPHQPGLVGPRARQTFGWPAERIVVTIDHLGNCLAATLPASLSRPRARGACGAATRYCWWAPALGCRSAA